MKYRVVVEERAFEIEIGPDGQVWVDRQPLRVDLEKIDGLPQYSLLVDHRSYEAHVEGQGDGECQVVVAGRPYRAVLEAERSLPPQAARGASTDGPSVVIAPLPGLLVDVRVADGARVQQGDVVAVLESMKMNLDLRAPCAGVASVLVAAGQEVAQGEELVTIGLAT